MTKTRLSFIRKIYQALMKRLPRNYPRADLIIHPTLTELHKNYGKINKLEVPPAAFFDSSNNTIHISYNSTTRLDELVWLLLHEITHFYALKTYGDEDYRWSDLDLSEKYANKRADKWIKKLRKEGWFVEFEKEPL
jgi:hypothetical protein